MVESIKGIIILVVPLIVVFVLFIKWWREYKSKGLRFVLDCKKIKLWHVPLMIMILVLLVSVVLGVFILREEEAYLREEIKVKEWNPNAWHG